MLERALTFYTRYFAIWVVLFGLWAYVDPEPFAIMGKYMSWFFALTMFGIGAALDPDDFRNIARQPLIVLIGVVAQFSIMPFGAFMLAKLFRLPPEIAVGLILTGSAPGAMASNVMSYIAAADTAYSVSLTTVSTLLCPVLTPGLTWLLAQSYLPVAFWPMFLSVIKMVILPLAVGLTVKHYFRRPMERIARVFPALSATFIIFICCVVIAQNRKHLAELTASVVAAAVVLNLYGMLAGYGVGRLFRLGPARSRTLCIEIGMQNAGLGTVLAVRHFGARTALPAAAFVFICILTASAMVRVWSRAPKPAPAGFEVDDAE